MDRVACVVVVACIVVLVQENILGILTDRVDSVERSTQSEVHSTQSEVLSTQSELHSTQSELHSA